MRQYEKVQKATVCYFTSPYLLFHCQKHYYRYRVWCLTLRQTCCYRYWVMSFVVFVTTLSISSKKYEKKMLSKAIINVNKLKPFFYKKMIITNKIVK